MGIIIAKFRKKKTTLEVLEKLDNEIKSIEEFGRNTEQTQKKMVGRFVFISVCVYVVTALIFYFRFFPASVYERIVYVIPLIILPVLLLFIKHALTWYYNRKIRKNRKKLSTLNEEKKKILEEVMDKETYKVAKIILDKFAPEQVRKGTPYNGQSTPARPAVTAGPLVPSQSAGLRYRGAGQFPPNRLSFGGPMTPIPSRALMPPPTLALPKTPGQSQSVVPARPTLSGTPLMLPRGILPRERTVLDKMVDYLVGDGPSNRYALICKNCSSHNGMALKEEFEYLSFRCCYCLAMNPAQKKRPAAPKLDSSSSPRPKFSDASDSDKNWQSDSDSDSDGGGPSVTIMEPPEPRSDTPVVKDSGAEEQEVDVETKNVETEATPMEVDTSVEGHVDEERSDVQEGQINVVQKIWNGTEDSPDKSSDVAQISEGGDAKTISEEINPQD